jgi:hypothetical protein
MYHRGGGLGVGSKRSRVGSDWSIGENQGYDVIEIGSSDTESDEPAAKRHHGSQQDRFPLPSFMGTPVAGRGRGSNTALIEDSKNTLSSKKAKKVALQEAALKQKSDRLNQMKLRKEDLRQAKAAQLVRARSRVLV